MIQKDEPKIIEAYCPKCYDKLKAFIKKPHKPKTKFVYIGEQETGVKGQTWHLYNCLECNSTYTIGTMVEKRFSVAKERGELEELL